MKIPFGRIIKAIGVGAYAVAKSTPQGAMAASILQAVRSVRESPTGMKFSRQAVVDLDGDGIPDIVDIRAEAVEHVEAALPFILQAAMPHGAGTYTLDSVELQRALESHTDAVHRWMERETVQAYARLQAQVPFPITTAQNKEQ